MNGSRFFVIALVGGLLASQANAQDIYKSGGGSVFAGLNYTFVGLDVGSADADVGTLSGKAGAMLTPFIGFEARAGFGVDDDRVGLFDYSLDNFYGAYGTFQMANESPLTPYAAIGFTRVEIEADGPLGTSTEDESDVSYGVGLNVDFASYLSGNLEYMRYYDDNDVTVDGLGLGFQFSF
ncbi:outer membrane beta-barrel protein [Marinobacter sp. chi1]|uniref:Outer membrane beta-barrel protein n=1 Tax=Marinobacter suaedae TaxID=3057675 RepID=A0ABT8W1T0_9GAMM|nr:outer membrane beta-barrel protein [Marinobacter sp. chi1]MDO3722197.1 outer membrane beta-barrel protein [Marinobacter sp. chi1]